MSKYAALTGVAQAHLESRRCRIRGRVDHPLRAAGATAEPLPADRVHHLLREAEDLFWNELSWEQATDEEVISGGRLTELVFPGFLAFVDGLLPNESRAGSRPHPDVVEQILIFLSQQFLRFTSQLEGGADSQRLVWARAMTARLIDLVLYRLHQLTAEECEALDGAG
jgi:hypothetical protein